MTVTAVGLAYCGKLTLNSIFQLLSLRIRSINGIREYAAITTVIAFISWTGCHLVFLLTGVVLLVTKNRSGINITVIVLTCLVVSGTAMLSIAAYVVDKRRKRLVHKIADIENFDAS